MSGPLRALLLAAFACGGSSTNVASLTVTPASAELVVGQSVQLVAVARDGDGEVVEPEIRWSTPSPAVSIGEDGTVTAVALGSATITALAGGTSTVVVVRVLPGALVGAAGARIESGSDALVVPAGAVGEGTMIAIDSNASIAMDPMVVEGSSVRVIAGAPLAVPATLELGYIDGRQPVGAEPDDLAISRLDGETWRDVEGSAGAAGKVTAPITTGGTYVVRLRSPSTPCLEPERRQFDFWLGSWDIHSVGGGGGHSEITRDEAGCLIFEHFTDLNVVGLSINFWSPADGRWHETYVDNQGTRLEISGGLVNGSMVLGTPEAQRMTRITWSKRGSSVRQLGEITGNGGASWTTQFDGTYEPAP